MRASYAPSSHTFGLRLNLLCALVLFAAFAVAQAPEGISYQAVVRNATGLPMPNADVSFRMTLHRTNPTGPQVYQEVHDTTTNARGLVSFTIGGGSPTAGTFSSIDWSAGPYFMEVELDTAGGSNYISLGTQQLVSVPYALYARSAGGTTAGTSRVPVVRVFTSSGTWSKPVGLAYVVVEVVGGGGGGGAGIESGVGSEGGGGGGGGGYARKVIAATQLNPTVAITIGAGGLPGVVAGTAHDGNSGSVSSFGSHCSATGGAGGRGDSNTATSYLGGDGGLGVGGDVNVKGGGGGAGDRFGNGGTIAGAGGSSVLGGGANGYAGYQSYPGATGGAYGGGGSGGYDADSDASEPGGAGASGIVVVTEYY